MTSSMWVNDLAQVLVPIGVAGAVLAGLCAVIAAFAIVRGAGGLCAGAVGVWIPGVILSSTSSFAGLWLPLQLSVFALAVGLVGGGIIRAVVSATAPRRALTRAARAEVRDAARVAADARIAAVPAKSAAGAITVSPLAQQSPARAA
ncbi:hypothetical protein [Microbacterium aurantiacum]|uniref:hypothetical protein n=1 Tax=Microbacterium aurantiacum TaxID=162393 RepID=UPI000C80827B|nr:hypothetical protein [Microbacterium aurantiacum]